jgi:hypothetical protein
MVPSLAKENGTHGASPISDLSDALLVNTALHRQIPCTTMLSGLVLAFCVGVLRLLQGSGFHVVTVGI